MNLDSLVNKLTIEPLTTAKVALDLAAKEGWNIHVNVADCFVKADSQGFYAAILDDEIVGVVSVVKYSKKFAFEGLLVVKPEFRGKGIGLAIRTFVNQISNDVNLGLDTVLHAR